MKNDREFAQMKTMKAIIRFMQEETIITKRQATMLKNRIQKWWFVKTKQMDKYREEKLKYEKGIILRLIGDKIKIPTGDRPTKVYSKDDVDSKKTKRKKGWGRSYGIAALTGSESKGKK